MAKESLYAPQKAPIFRETFADEQTTRVLGGVPTSVTYSNGVGTFAPTTGGIGYKKNVNGVYSVRFVFNILPPLASANILDCRASSGVGLIYFDTSTLQKSSGTAYVNGIATGAISSATKEIVVSGITLNATQLNLLIGYTGTGNTATDSLELFEIYDYTLTANEVANLANNKRYEALQYGSGVSEILNIDAKNGVIANKYSGGVASVTNLVTNGDFASGTGWNLTTGVTITGGQAVFAAMVNGNYLFTDPALVAGKKYRITYTISGFVAGSIQVAIGFTAGTTRSANGTYTEDIICGAGSTCKFTVTGTTTLNLDNVIAQEIAPDIINTSVAPVRSGNIWAMDFNGTSSKLDCGSYNTLVGDKSFIAWIKAERISSSSIEYIFNNGSLLLAIDNGTWYVSNGILISSDGSLSAPSAYSSNNAIKRMIPFQVVVTRTSTGVANIYVNGVLTGSANQASGTPAAGSTNLTLGASSASSNLLDGHMSAVRIIDGILTAQEISQLFSAERKNYNV